MSTYLLHISKIYLQTSTEYCKKVMFAGWDSSNTQPKAKYIKQHPAANQNQLIIVS